MASHSGDDASNHSNNEDEDTVEITFKQQVSDENNLVVEQEAPADKEDIQDIKDNIALGKETSQSSGTYSDKFGPGLAVDGQRAAGYIHNGYMCTHTENEYQPWWAVDLGKLYLIKNVIIFGRTDCCADRLSKFDIDVFWHNNGLESNSSWYSFHGELAKRCHYQEKSFTGLGLNVTCQQNTLGRYLRIKLRRKNALSLCEVKVYGSAIFDSSSSLGLDSLDFHHSIEYSGPFIQISNATNNIKCNNTCNSLSGCETFQFSDERQRCVMLLISNETSRDGK